MALVHAMAFNLKQYETTKNPDKDKDMTAPVISGGDSAAPTPQSDAGRGRRREISSEELFGSNTELTILHKGERYTLRITANQKLILTK
jgi:hemin uptake protein HemP